MIKNSHDKIIKGEPKEQLLNIVLKFCSYIYIYIYREREREREREYNLLYLLISFYHIVFQTLPDKVLG